MATCLDVSYTPYDASLRGKTGNIIRFTHFEEGNLSSETHNLLSEIRNDTESGNDFDNDSTMLPLMSEEEIDVMSSGDESDDEHMSTDILEDIRDGS